MPIGGESSIAVLQFVYVAVGLTRYYSQSRAAIPPMQSAIGQMLQTELEVPRNLPPASCQVDDPRRYDFFGGTVTQFQCSAYIAECH
jgi:hypothetical protein